MRFLKFLLISSLLHILFVLCFLRLEYESNKEFVKSESLNLNFVKVVSERKKEADVKNIPKVQKHNRNISEKKTDLNNKKDQRKINTEEKKVKKAENIIEEAKSKDTSGYKDEEITNYTNGNTAGVKSDKIEKTENKSIEPSEKKGNYQKEYKAQNLSKIRDIVRSFLRYPLIAKKMGWEGTVVLKFTIYPNGMLKNIEIEKSSGFEVLDKNAVKVIRSVSSKFPRPERPVTIVLPITYRLK